MSAVTSSLRGPFDSLRRKDIIDWVSLILGKEEMSGVNAIAVRGISGIVMGSIVAHVLNLKLIVVRKENEDSHASYQVEGLSSDLKYVIIDDLVSSGRTVKTIMQDIKNSALGRYINIECAGILLYTSHAYNIAGSPVCYALCDNTTTEDRRQN